MSTAVATETKPLFDISGEKFNAMWVDEKQPLFIPNNPIHFKAHKLQVMLARLDKQAEKNPAQFNSTGYLTILNEYARCCEAIKEGHDDEVLDKGSMDQVGNAGAAPAYGEIEPISMDS